MSFQISFEDGTHFIYKTGIGAKNTPRVVIQRKVSLVHTHEVALIVHGMSLGVKECAKLSLHIVLCTKKGKIKRTFILMRGVTLIFRKKA